MRTIKSLPKRVLSGLNVYELANDPQGSVYSVLVGCAAAFLTQAEPGHILATTVTDRLRVSLGSWLLHQQMETVLILDESIVTKYVKMQDIKEACNRMVFCCCLLFCFLLILLLS